MQRTQGEEHDVSGPNHDQRGNHQDTERDVRDTSFLEDEPELDKVLNIFVRTNSGGTILSNSDLLLSITVAQFKELDARHEVNERTDINRVRFNIRNFNLRDILG